MNAFDAPDQKTLLDLYDKWDESYPKIWRGIGFSDMEEKFRQVSDKPMLGEEQSLLESGLREVEEINRDFLAMAIARGELLIQNELKTNLSVNLGESQGLLPIKPSLNGHSGVQGVSYLS